MTLLLSILIILWAVFGGAGPLFAYSDEISAPLEEVWQAVQETLAPYGIKKIKPHTNEIESRWIKDRVKRSRGLLKNVASQLYERRYRLKIRLNQAGGLTSVAIRGTFEEKPYDSPPAVHWQSYKLESSDYDAERNFFMQILKTLQSRRQNPAQ